MTFFFLFAPTRLDATIVIAIWTPDALYIGADSRMTSLDHKRFGSICKIQIERDMIFSYAGFFRFRGILDVPALIKETAAWGKGRDDLDAIRNHFVGDLIVPLAEARERIRKMPETTRTAIPETGELIVLLARNGTGRITYSATTIANQEPRFDPETGKVRAMVSRGTHADLPSSGCAPMEIILAGNSKEAREYLVANPELTPGDPVSVIRTLAEVAAKNNPLTVGGPMAILKVNNDGKLEWLERGMCQESKKGH